MKKLLFIIGLVLSVQSLVYSQTKTNLEITFQLIDRTISRVDSFVNNKNKEYNFSFTSPEPYGFLKSTVVDSFIKKNYLLKNLDSLQNKIEYSIHNIKVGYSNPFKDRFFGSIFVEREVTFNGSSLISDFGEISSIQLNQTIKDTVALDQISYIENRGIPFTQATIPEIPLFSNLLEPIIVVGTLIVTIILFFTVRSK